MNKFILNQTSEGIINELKPVNLPVCSESRRVFCLRHSAATQDGRVSVPVMDAAVVLMGDMWGYPGGPIREEMLCLESMYMFPVRGDKAH